VEPLPVHRPPAHRAAGTSPFLVPLLDAASAELVGAPELHERPRLAVANRAFTSAGHFVCRCLLLSPETFASDSTRIFSHLETFIVSYIKMALSPPTDIIRPKSYGRKPNNYYTLHSKQNDIFSIKIKECEKTTVVGFKNRSDAIFIAQMIETHFMDTNEWPDTRNEGTLFLPKSKVHDLELVVMHEWDFEDLKFTCTANIMDMVSVDGIIDNNSHFSFSGNLYKFEADLDFYKERFEQFLN